MKTRVLDLDEIMQVGDIAIYNSLYRELSGTDEYEMVINGLAGDPVTRLVWDGSWWDAVLRPVDDNEEIHTWDFSFQVKCTLQEAEILRDWMEDIGIEGAEMVSFHKLLPEDGGE